MRALPIRLFVVAALSGAAPSAIAEPAGKAIYDSTCIACHGADGQGVLPGVPDLTASKQQFAAGEASLLLRIRDGYQSPGSPMAMPPKGGNPSLTDADLKAVLDYIKETFAR
jgi:cytochrome c5